MIMKMMLMNKMMVVLFIITMVCDDVKNDDSVKN